MKHHRLFATILLTALLPGLSAACLSRPALGETGCIAEEARTGPGAFQEMPEGSPPEVIVLDDADAIASYRLPDCFGIAAGDPPSTLVILRGRPTGTTFGEIIDRIAAFSTLEDVSYWSRSRGEWRPLVSQTRALAGPDPDTITADPKPETFVEGAVFHVLQDDSDPLTAMVVRIVVEKRAENSIVMTFENITAGRVMGLTVLPAGSMRSLLAVEQSEADGIAVFLLSGNSAELPGWMLPGPESHINRAVAVYRHLVGIPSDREPPAAR